MNATGANKFLVIDIETWMGTTTQLDRFRPVYIHKEFDPAEIKTGNLKDPAKIEAKLKEAELHHAAAEEQHQKTLNEEYEDRACLRPHTSRLFAWGWQNGSDGGLVQAHPDPSVDAERRMLNSIWSLIDNYRGEMPIGGWNFLGFDLPFLIRRSSILRVSHPKFDLPLFRNDDLFDLMQIWTLNRALSRDQLPGSLNDAAKILGLESKTDLDGQLVWEIYNEGNADLGYEYIRRDINLTYEIGEILLDPTKNYTHEDVVEEKLPF